MGDAPLRNDIPVTVFTGFLGAGKTSLILSLLPHLPKYYKVVLLKNEFGDVEVDSQLAKQSSLASVSEILNGCMCCVLVGKMKNALLEIRENFAPDRVIIECSGSAFPATIAWQIRELEKETEGGFKLDAILTVIDAENFTGYEDDSPTAKMQAKYTDILLVNKYETVSERALDIVIDHLNTLNDMTPKIKCPKGVGVDPSLIFNLDSTLYQLYDSNLDVPVNHHDEVETATVWRGGSDPHTHGAAHNPHHDHDHDHESGCHAASESATLTEESLTAALSVLPKEDIYRVKGFVRLPAGMSILNWAFGRFELTPLQDEREMKDVDIRLTVMGARGEVKRRARKLAEMLGANLS
ncbi:cobW-domain-containing protein [Dacryopinax primogenitus]|uniref:CobW-domain-containing protein n=1 Tax=Dacryopinax primogenitus (strain DJM 731) TaxID=1858805 RepID=M5G3A8_DACPD|nr:cobW-domain-containing protein [Dacryopinax primogenitus]EJU04686.1 cobW-domain-containing protein [Dacryopinax primogenitus]